MAFFGNSLYFLPEGTHRRAKEGKTMTVKHLKKGLKVRFARTDGSGKATGTVERWFKGGEIMDLRTGRRYREWEARVRLDNPRTYKADGKIMTDDCDFPRVADLRIAR